MFHSRTRLQIIVAKPPRRQAPTPIGLGETSRCPRYLADECGIRQFIDIGPGLPAPGNTHEIAQAVAPDCRIVYVDDDPLVLTYARALLTSSPQGSCSYLDADLRDTPTVLAGASRTLDLTRPTAVLLLAVLHFIPDSDKPAAIVAALARQLTSGSYLVISHLTADFAPGPVDAGVRAYNALVPTALIPRSHSQVSALFADLPLVPPGVVPLTEWRPAPNYPSPPSSDMYAGVARAPWGSARPTLVRNVAIPARCRSGPSPRAARPARGEQ